MHRSSLVAAALSATLGACVAGGAPPPAPLVTLPATTVPAASSSGPPRAATSATPGTPALRKATLVSLGDLDDVLQAPATLGPMEEAHATARASGTVSTLGTQVGGRVHKGDVLVTITTDPPGARQVDVTAPRDGVVLECKVHVGDHVAASSVLARTADLSTILVTVAVPEARAGAVKVGDPLALRIPAFPARVYMARLTRVAPVVGADHVLPVMATMDNPDRALLPGMSGTAAVTLATKTHVTMVPREAIVDQGGHPAVFVLEDMHVHARAVDLGLDGGRLVEIVSGVVAGNLVVTPAEGLVDGDVFVGAP